MSAPDPIHGERPGSPIHGEVSFRGAEQLLLPPRNGLPWSAGRRAGEQTLHPGGLGVREGLNQPRSKPDPRATLQVDASGCAVVPGFVDCHTHLPFAGWREGEYDQKLPGVPYEEISRGGGGIAASARALRESMMRRYSPGAGLAAEMLAIGNDLLRDQVRLRPVARGGVAGAAAGPRGSRTRCSDDGVDGAAGPLRPPGLTAAEWMRGGGDDARGGRRWADGQRAGHLRRVVAFSNADLETMGALAAAAGLALRAHVEQFGGYRSVPVALAAGARSVDHCRRWSRTDMEPLAAAPVRGGSAAGGRVPGRRAAGARPGTARCGRAGRAGHRSEPRDGAGDLDAAGAWGWPRGCTG